MPFGRSIKQVLKSAGAPVTILRSGGDISGEYVPVKVNAQATKPFIRGFFLEAQLAYDTDIIAGDVISFDITGIKYLVMHRTPVVFEAEVAKYDSVLYKCNVSGELKRPADADWNDQYHRETTFQTMDSECYGLMTEALYGHDLETDEELGALGIANHELYIRETAGVEILDRYEPVSGEYWMVTTKKPRKYENIDVVTLETDTR